MSESLKDEKHFTGALITMLARLGEVPSRDTVATKAKGLAELFEYTGDLSQPVEDALTAIVTRMGIGVSLVDNESAHDDEWALKRPIKSVYAEAYEKFLAEEGWAPEVVQALSDTGTKILGHLEDPQTAGAWNRRGLVIGHVQSGKTANYMGLIAKAADAGYKFIIVVAGIHNNLRKQTQERIDEALIGRSSDPSNRKLVGVGLSGTYPHPVTLTNINDDFSTATAERQGWKLNDFSKPIVLIIKKNVTTLNALHKWLKDMNAAGDGRISDVPMLLIDDEADNASINTNKEDVSPTRTNRMLRRILGLFAKSCYVGYTATPFANIFINPDAYDPEDRDELFPKHFIYSLDAPTTYFGPDRVFLDEESSAQIVRPITDGENFLPQSHKRDDPVSGLPPSLHQAFDEFIVARAIRNIRGQSRKHCSMMVNVSRFVPVQRTVRDLLSLYEKKVRDAVKANYAMPESVSAGNKHMQALRAAYDREFTACGSTWDEVKAALGAVFDNLRLYVINSKSDEALDYKKYEDAGEGLTAIAIGGLSLSRGLTIEGLTMSYMYRNTKMYDTLMQMGRWFGYRPRYDDLCRVYLADDSTAWYRHIGLASEELRDQIRRMRRDGLTPKQFGLYVLAHPDSLLVTAKNKMRTGERRVVRQNYSGQLIESVVLPMDKETNQENERLIASAWQRGFGTTLEDTGKGWIARDVPIAEIDGFLRKFKVHSAIDGRKSTALDYLQVLSDRHPLGDILLISPKDEDARPAEFRLGRQERRSTTKDDRFENAWHASRDRVASRGDEGLGLSIAQKDAAKAEADKDGKQIADRHYRRQREKPLLMIHILGPVGDDDEARIPAFGISFPYGHYDKTVEVVVNKVWLEMFGDMTPDDPDLEDDFDE